MCIAGKVRFSSNRQVPADAAVCGWFVEPWDLVWQVPSLPPAESAGAVLKARTGTRAFSSALPSQGVRALQHFAVLQPAFRGAATTHAAFCYSRTHQHFSCAKKVLVK